MKGKLEDAKERPKIKIAVENRVMYEQNAGRKKKKYHAINKI